MVDTTIVYYITEKADYCSISAARTFPHGLDHEVFSIAVLEMAYKNATKDYEKEHVTPYIYRSNPGIFKICVLDAPQELYDPEIRITLDTEEDYAVLCCIFDNLNYKNMFFNAKDIIDLFKEKPWIRLINKKIAQKKMFDTLEQEIEEALKIVGLNDLRMAKKAIEECLQRQRG
jgi:spore coat polysaccharide biosynthesis protein SpsF